jgi:aryl-alcohol dehydrogenase-like predicted oxidoreductase
VIPRLAAKGVAVIAREPLGQGLLTGTRGRTLAEEASRSRSEINWRKMHSKAFYGLAVPQRTLAQAALQFVLQVPGVSTVIPGIAHWTQVEENLGALSAPRLTSEEIEGARTLSALPAIA